MFLLLHSTEKLNQGQDACACHLTEYLCTYRFFSRTEDGFLRLGGWFGVGASQLGFGIACKEFASNDGNGWLWVQDGAIPWAVTPPGGVGDHIPVNEFVNEKGWSSHVWNQKLVPLN